MSARVTVSGLRKRDKPATRRTTARASHCNWNGNERVLYAGQQMGHAHKTPSCQDSKIDGAYKIQETQLEIAVPDERSGFS